MAAKEKEIKKISDKDLVDKLAKSLSVLKSLQKMTEELKQKLRRKCQDQFLRDIKKGKIYGNHTYKTENGPLTVNFRVAPESEITHYERSLASDLYDNWEKLFEETEEIIVSTTPQQTGKQFLVHPELFTLSLKPAVTMNQMLELYKKYPDLFDVNVRSKERYKEVYPNNVETKRKVFPKNGFIEKLGKIEENLRKRVLNSLSKYFEKYLETAIKQ